MKLKTAIILSAWLCFAQPIYGLLSKDTASQTTSPASAKEYSLGETIQVREGVTLKVVKGSSRSVELFKSKPGVTDQSIVLDLEIEIKQTFGGIYAFSPGDGAGKSDAFLNAGEEKIMPKGYGSFPSPEAEAMGRVPEAKWVQNNLHVAGGLATTRKDTHSFLFELNVNQLKQEKTHTLNLEIRIAPAEERYSFVIHLAPESRASSDKLGLEVHGIRLIEDMSTRLKKRRLASWQKIAPTAESY